MAGYHEALSHLVAFFYSFVLVILFARGREEICGEGRQARCQGIQGGQYCTLFLLIKCRATTQEQSSEVETSPPLGEALASATQNGKLVLSY